MSTPYHATNRSRHRRCRTAIIYLAVMCRSGNCYGQTRGTSIAAPKKFFFHSFCLAASYYPALPPRYPRTSSAQVPFIHLFRGKPGISISRYAASFDMRMFGMLRFEFILLTPCLRRFGDVPRCPVAWLRRLMRGHLEIDAWWRNSPWPCWANCAAHHRQEEKQSSREMSLGRYIVKHRDSFFVALDNHSSAHC